MLILVVLEGNDKQLVLLFSLEDLLRKWQTTGKRVGHLYREILGLTQVGEHAHTDTYLIRPCSAIPAFNCSITITPTFCCTELGMCRGVKHEHAGCGPKWHLDLFMMW